jgi:hypothetical protein
MQEQPPPQPAPTPNFDVHIDLSGLANLIWQSFIDHIGDVGTAVWAGIKDHLGEIGNAILAPLEATLQRTAQAVWDAVWGSSANIVTQLPADLTYNFGPYRAVATDPVALAVGGATLALVLLGLRTLLGSMVGRDHVITHVTGRLIPAVFLTLAYPVLIVQGIGVAERGRDRARESGHRRGDRGTQRGRGWPGDSVRPAVAAARLVRGAAADPAGVLALPVPGGAGVRARGAHSVGDSTNRVADGGLAARTRRLGHDAGAGDRMPYRVAAGQWTIWVPGRCSVRHRRLSSGARPGRLAGPLCRRQEPVADRVHPHGRGCGQWRRCGGSRGEHPCQSHDNARRDVRISMRTCQNWGEDKLLSEFPRDRRQCRTCTSRQAREWRIRNRERHHANFRRWELRTKFALTPEEYDALLAAQGGVCAICGTAERECRDGQPKHFAIDHDHRTGRVRGLLCHLCNQTLGRMKDRPELFEKAAVYLRSFSDGYQ